MQAYHGVHAGTPYPQVQSLPYNYATRHVYIYIYLITSYNHTSVRLELYNASELLLLAAVKRVLMRRF